MRNESTKLILVCNNENCKRFGMKTARRFDVLRDFSCPSCSIPMSKFVSPLKLSQDAKAKQDLMRLYS